MAFSTALLIALIGAIGFVNCQRFQQDRLAEGCSGKVMDIFFILDSSSSIYINDYMSQHAFVKDIVRQFDVGQATTRVGLLTYADDLTRPIIGLNRYIRKQELLNSIEQNNLPYMTGVTNTDVAIRYVRQLNEFRRDITKVMVVLTDGGSRSPGATSREAELARAAGFYMFVAGIGQYLEEREWRSIASDPDDSFIFNITYSRLMEDVKNTLPTRACNLPPIILGGSCDVSRPSELYFVGGESTNAMAVEVIETFTRRTTDRRDSLRVSYFIDGCASLTNNILVNSDPFSCQSYDLTTGVPVVATSANDQFANAVRAARNSRNLGPDNNKIIVLFLDDATLNTNRFDLANAARNAQSFDDITVVIADMGTRNYREFAQRLTTDRNNFVSFTGGPISLQTQASSRLIRATCDAVNDYGNRNVNPNFSGTVV